MGDVDHATSGGDACTWGRDGCCTGCGVSRSECSDCGGIGYHREGCRSDEAGMTKAEAEVAAAIEESIAYDKIAHIEWSEDAESELLVLCDDSADNGPVSEYWGTDDDGAEWRVHLTRTVAS